MDGKAQHYFQIHLNLFEENWKPFEDVIPCLEAHKEYRLGIITNGDSTQQRQKLKKIGIFDYFEIVIAAGDIGVSKPNTEIFRYACSMAQEHPADRIYIGDNLETDIFPCEKIDMKGIWLNRKNEIKGQEHIRTIKILFDLPKILENM
ncbi:HAD-IA family hydrolase [Paenibacillus sp. Marseille-Q4541]|uniref:HAD family hydrolase n=1 Tax=Paenibacillus sp. Marseille-Q4541 TaxID=2831522 RepID=UPI001BA4DAF7|nr:HAD-IA family hydrolase [Paenibacillus sp. Marseille-Q4541]